MNFKAKNNTNRYWGDFFSLIIAILIPLAAFVVQWIFWNSFKPFAWIFFYPAVFLSAWIGGLRSGLVSIVFSTLVIWWFFIPDRYSFFIDHPAFAFTMLVFTSMGILVSFTIEQLQKANLKVAENLEVVNTAREQLEQQVEERTKKLADSNRELLSEVTMRRQIEDELRESQLLLQASIDSPADIVILAMMMKELLNKIGCTVSNHVTTGENAILKANENPPDIILMDIRLAGEIDGIEAAAKIKAESDIPVIFVTGYDDQIYRGRAEKLNPLAYLIKPVNTSELKKIIDSHFA